MKFSKLILKNILRNKRRSLLTISSLVVSLFLIITLATILTEFSRSTDEANPSRLVTRHTVSLASVLPAADQQRIAQVPGVKSVMKFSWFGGIYKEEKNFFANFAVDADKMREIMPELKMSDAEWQAFIATLDHGPGYWNGILSLWFNSSDPPQEFSDEEQKAQPYFHRKKAAELLALLDRTIPAASARPPSGLNAASRSSRARSSLCATS